MVFCQTCWAEPCFPCVPLEISFIQQIVVKHLFHGGAGLEPDRRVAADSERQIGTKDTCLPNECQALALPPAWGCRSTVEPLLTVPPDLGHKGHCCACCSAEQVSS